MNEERSIALVGRPNVGKSRLFNHLAGKRLAIVHNEPGVTRDVKTAEVNGDYTLMDTGGIGLVDEKIETILMDAVDEQVFFAIAAASIILFVVDGKEGLMPLDETIANHLRNTGKRVLMIVNKIDTPKQEITADEFSSLGIEEPILISAEHGRGISVLQKKIVDLLGPLPENLQTAEKQRIKICFMGRPNVGKSSLCNQLLKTKRLIISQIPGTTRDSIELDLDYKETDETISYFRLIDTAGVRKRGKMSSSVEYFSSVRSEKAMASAEVVFLVLDARNGVTTQDKALAGKIVEAGKAIAVIVNKWDYALDSFSEQPLQGYNNEEDFRKHFEKEVRKALFFLPASPILFLSAQTGYNIESLLFTAEKLHQRSRKKLSTAHLNQLLQKYLAKKEPSIINGKRLKIYYGVQTGVAPHIIRLFCNQPARLEENYRRYLEKNFTEKFQLGGCPLRFNCIGKEKRYSSKP